MINTIKNILTIVKVIVFLIMGAALLIVSQQIANEARWYGTGMDVYEYIYEFKDLISATFLIIGILCIFLGVLTLGNLERKSFRNESSPPDRG